MNIITKGHELDDAVRQVLQLFFDISTDFTAVSELSVENNIYKAAATITIGDKTAYGNVEKQLFSPCNNLHNSNTHEAMFLQSGGASRGKAQSDFSPARKDVSDLIKKSVFFACKKLSDMPTPWGVSTGIRPAKTARMMLDDGFSDDEILKFMQDEYFVSVSKAQLSFAVAKKEAELLKNREKNGISIYVGVPFCPTRCSYCSFISQAVAHNKKFLKPYAEALMKEIEATAALAQDFGYKTETVYFGGGTPTTLPPEILDKVIKKVKDCFDVSILREFTVEAGRPDTFSDEMLSVLRENGVNRISINPQTMNQKTLDLIGRKHTVEDTVRAFEMTRKYNSFSINADIIAGLPGETPADFEKTVKEVTKLNPDAVTVHTMYMKRAARLIDEFENLRFATNTSEMVDYSHKYLIENGFNPYYMYKQRNTLGNLENTAFAKTGHESLYNIYIMEEIQTIFALGGGASTKMVKGDRIERVFNPKEAGDYIKRIDEIIEKKKKAVEFLKD